MQVLQANVQRGSRVYERGHLLVLAWAEAQCDQEVIWKVLSQVRLLCSRALCCPRPVVRNAAHCSRMPGCSSCLCEALVNLAVAPAGLPRRRQGGVCHVLCQARAA